MLKILHLIFLILILSNLCSCMHKKHKGHHHKHKPKPRPPAPPTPPPTPPPAPATAPTTTSITTTTTIDQNQFDYLKFLERNRYDLGIPSRKQALIDARNSSNQDNIEIKNMLSLFQKLHRLKVTGVLDEATIDKMKSPSCANADIMIKDSRIVKRSLHFYDSIWNKKELSYKILNYDKSLGNYTREAIRTAFDDWQKATDFIFTEVTKLSEKTDIVIDFVDREHNDGFSFDDSVEELAHAFFPEDGRIHFYNKRQFTENTTDGYNLRIVAAHEIGHALGLGHTYEPDSLMYKYYIGFIPDFSLPDYDREQIQLLYDLDLDSSESSSTYNPFTTTTTPIVEENDKDEKLQNVLDRLNDLESRVKYLEKELSHVYFKSEETKNDVLILASKTNSLNNDIKVFHGLKDTYINKIVKGEYFTGYFHSGTLLSQSPTIQFGVTFRNIPTVIVEPEIIDFVVQPIRLITKISNVQNSSFVLEISTWYTSKIHQMKVRWTAIGQV